MLNSKGPLLKAISFFKASNRNVLYLIGVVYPIADHFAFKPASLGSVWTLIIEMLSWIVSMNRGTINELRIHPLLCWKFLSDKDRCLILSRYWLVMRGCVSRQRAWIIIFIVPSHIIRKDTFPYQMVSVAWHSVIRIHMHYWVSSGFLAEKH